MSHRRLAGELADPMMSEPIGSLRSSANPTRAAAEMGEVGA
ncbi:MAG: hypothetical protein WA484_15945 [Solirubrobacteraceae bacterium]